MPVQRTINHTMLRKKYMLIAFLLIMAAGVVYVYKEFNRASIDIASQSSAYSVEANQLIKEFVNNDSLATLKYVGKIISLQGVVKEMRKDELGYCTVTMGDTAAMSSVSCSIDSMYSAAAASIKRGMILKVKGNCTGFNEDELLGLDIIFNRCIIVDH